MNLIKKIAIATSTFSLALGIYSAPVFAAAQAQNENISGDSFADSESYDNDVVDVHSRSVDTEFDNFDVGLANTGLNSQNGGEDGNDVVSDEAGASFETENYLNISEVRGQNGAQATNTNISGESDGDTVAYDNDVVTVNNRNEDTDFFNLTASVANTGLNSQDDNEDGNTTVAGAAYTYAGSYNDVNDNLVTTTCGSSACGQSSPTAQAVNSNISSGSFADSEATDNDVYTVSNNNTGTDFTNITAAVSNTGLNSQSGNEDGNEITTGVAQAGAEAQNFVNVNTTNLSSGGAVAKNTNVSGESDGDSTAEDNDVVTVSNVNSGTNVLNVTAAVSNTGGNTQNNNEDGNKTVTGRATVSGSTTNVVNANTVSW